MAVPVCQSLLRMSHAVPTLTRMTQATRDHLAALARYQADFLATTEHADPRTPVPWCGRWRVCNLVVHLARVHHWAAAQARRVQETPLGRGPFDLAPFYATCAAELLATLAELDPDARAWTLVDDGVPRAEQVGTVRFWHRRQALETLVHLWDLRTAVGQELTVETEAWVDCVDEVITVMHPRQIRLGRVETPKVRLRLEATDAVGRWDSLAQDGAAQSVTIAGPAQELALLVWGRATLDAPGLRVDGDPAAAAAVLAEGLTP